MRKLFIPVLVFSLLFLFTSCKKEAVKTEPIEKEPIEKIEEVTPKIEKPTLTEEEVFQKRSLEEVNKAGYFEKVHFDFDKYFVRDDMKPILQSNADFLLKYSNVEIMIEGHCDERGTVEYNMALGEKRAESAKNYLVSLGVPSERMNIISYGKSRNLVRGIDEATHYLNRRSEFVITKK